MFYGIGARLLASAKSHTLPTPQRIARRYWKGYNMNETQKEAICRLAQALQSLIPYLYVHIGEDLSKELAEATINLQSVLKE